jgi:hypothetical protein
MKAHADGGARDNSQALARKHKGGQTAKRRSAPRLACLPAQCGSGTAKNELTLTPRSLSDPLNSISLSHARSCGIIVDRFGMHTRRRERVGKDYPSVRNPWRHLRG